MLIRMQIIGVRSYTKDTLVEGKTVKVARRAATLKFADPDWDHPDVSGILQRFVEESDADYKFYVNANVGCNIEMLCPTINEAAGGGYFLTVEDARLTDKTELIAPKSTAVVDEGTTMSD